MKMPFAPGVFVALFLILGTVGAKPKEPPGKTTQLDLKIMRGGSVVVSPEELVSPKHLGPTA